MKRICFLVLAALYSYSLNSQRIDTLKIHSGILGTDRNFFVYTPREYNHDSISKYEVIYVFDAQAREYFDCVHSTLAFVNNSQFPMIVVGVVSNDRNNDFFPENEYPETYTDYSGHLGNADKFLMFISDELVPYIESSYRALPKRIAIGHSNGGTFLMYSLTQKPDLFDAYIAISPNWAYDRDQPVRRLEKFDISGINSVKYIYMCNANEGNIWKEWIPARKKAIVLLNRMKGKQIIKFDNEDFSATENHISVYPEGVFNGLKKYMAYQFFDADNLVSYYSELNSGKIEIFTPDQLIRKSTEFYLSGRFDIAIRILLWANQLYPENIRLYDQLGEMYLHKNDIPNAIKYYRIFDAKLEQERNSMPAEEFLKLKDASASRIRSLENKQKH